MNGQAEDRGLDPRAIAAAASAIALMIALAALASWLGWNAWRPPGARNGPNGPLDFEVDGARLESAPLAERDAYFAQKQRLLHEWGWVDRQAGIARIPIEDAMRLMTQPAPAQPRAGGAGRGREGRR